MIEAGEARGKFEFVNVSFHYPNDPRTILKNINLTIEPGECLVIVGENGAGKTTLIKLLMRLYDVTSGAILYNGVNIKDYDYDSYMNVLATVFQDYKILPSASTKILRLKSQKSMMLRFNPYWNKIIYQPKFNRFLIRKERCYQEGSTGTGWSYREDKRSESRFAGPCISRVLSSFWMNQAPACLQSRKRRCIFTFLK